MRAPTPGNGNVAEPAAPRQAPVAPPTRAHGGPAPATTSRASTGYERCSSCGSLVDVDQRYCLECGRRSGEPRLPFMDAVVFMDAMKRPAEPAAAPTKERNRRLSPNTALIAGVGTLLLALGIGVLIGRSGNHGGTQAAPPAQIVRIGGGEEATGKTSAKGGETVGGATTKGKSKKQIVEAKKNAAETGEGAKDVLHAVPGANLPPPAIKVGGKCEKKVAGCNEKGEFDGSFFGGEE